MNNYAKDILLMISIRDVAERYGIIFNRSGFAICPFHDEKTPSFKIRNDRYAHCFGCGVNADSISLTMRLFNLSFMDAISKLNVDFCLGLPIGRKPTLKEREISSKRIKEITSMRNEIEEKKKEWNDEYNRLMDLWVKYDIALRECAPKNALDDLDGRYVEAIKNIDYITYLLQSLPPEPK